jgi:hypothetical protein
MFAVLFLERDPLRLEDVPLGIWHWVQTVGGFAMVGLLFWLVFDWARRRPIDRARVPPWQTLFVLVGIVVAALVYLLIVPLRLYEFFQFWYGSALYPSPNGGAVEVVWKPQMMLYESVWLFVGGLISLIVVLLPFLLNVLALRWRRIFALAGLSFKEALRRRVLWAFSALLLVFLFGSWFISGRAKPEDQLRTYVQLVYWAMTPLLLFTSVLLAAFSIPADIRQQTIHTVLTKPVERFEVYLGRVLGFTGLMSLVLLFMASFSLLYVLRGVDPDAAAESLKARSPLFGVLSFENSESAEKATNVGEEWGYRSYITAPTGGDPPQTAVFHFSELPGSLDARKQVRCEFNFAIYRAYKGVKEARGISCAFAVQSWRFDPSRLDEYRKKRKEARNNPNGRTEAEVDNDLAKDFGFYEIDSFPVTNFHTLSRDLPVELFKNAAQSDPERRRELDQLRMKPAPIEVRVRCLDKQEYVGMARYDLYMRQDDPDAGGEARWFALNFLKGATGLWMRLILVIGVATALSTYLSNVISLLLSLMLYIGGLFREFIASVVVGKNVGGGPLQSLFSVVGRQIGVGASEQPPRLVSDGKWCVLMQHDTSHLEATSSRYIFGVFDPTFRWTMGRVFDLIPDVDRFDLTLFVSEGFDVSSGQLLASLLLLIGYLLPWAVLAFYLLKWREIASHH